VHALTTPLIVDKTTGKKFGKSEGNAVWLSAEKTSPYAFFQFWLNTADENVIDYLRLFTDISLEAIDDIGAALEQNPGTRSAQRQLAKAVTTLVHGESVAVSVERVSDCLFGDVSVKELSDYEYQLLEANAPLFTVSSPVPLVDVLVVTALATSKREARTFIESGAISVDGLKISDVLYDCSLEKNGRLVHVKRGKKQVALVKFS
jgi:tyrosyl-tRNA synthetase